MEKFSRFFIERPIFASVMAIIITLAGAVAASCVALAVASTAGAPPHLANARDNLRTALAEIVKLN